MEESEWYQNTETSAHMRKMAFVAEYLANGYDAKAAYMSVFPRASARSAMTTGPALLKSDACQDILNQVRSNVMEKMEISEERILQEIACLAFVDLTTLYTDAGELLPISEMPEHARRAISGLETSDGPLGTTLRKLKVESKRGALELLGKNLKMFTDRTEISGEMTLAQCVADLDKRKAKESEPQDEMFE